MTQDEYLEKILNGLHCCKLAIHETNLLDLAYELGDEYSEKNFDRVNLLLDCYRSRYLGLLDEIQGSLLWAEEYLKLPLENQDIS